MKNLIYFAFISFLFYSCSNGIYLPSSISTPLFTEKGQIYLSGTTGLRGNIQGAYAISDNMAISGDISKFNLGYARKGPSDIILRGFGNAKGFSLGYFSKTKENVLWEIFGGFEKITTKTKIDYIEKINETSYKSHNPKFDIDATKLYLQPSIGFSNKNAEISLSCRVNNLHFKKPKSEVPDSIMIETDLIRIKNNFALLDPAITLRFGTKYVKFQIQLSKSLSIGKNLGINNTKDNLSIGLIAKFPTKKLPKNKF